jgi:hypothetical protein
MNRHITICKSTFYNTGCKEGAHALMLRTGVDGLRISNLQPSVTFRLDQDGCYCNRQSGYWKEIKD